LLSPPVLPGDVEETANPTFEEDDVEEGLRDSGRDLVPELSDDRDDEDKAPKLGTEQSSSTDSLVFSDGSAGT
jgi:hypothetical protein